MEKIILKGQRTFVIPVVFGINRVKIKVIKGKLRINHGMFTPDGGTWLCSRNPVRFRCLQGSNS